MGDTAFHFSDREAHEQVLKGVQTGFDEHQALVFILEKSAAWKESGHLNVLLLRALCQLSIANPERSGQGYTSWELVDAISQIRGRAWSDGSDKEQMSDDVRQQWNKLLKTWAMKSEGIAQQLTDACFTHVPRLTKTEGGGTGKLTLHRIEWLEPEGSLVQTEPTSAVQPTINKSVAVRYVCEDIEEVNPFARIFSRGYLLKGWRRQIYIVALAAPLLFLWLLLVQVSLGLTMSLAIGGKSILTSLLSSAVIFWAVMVTVGPMYRLGVDRIVIAPWWMQSTEEDRLLERRAPPRYPDKSVKAVRYVAICPLCGGAVSATKGRLEFFGRIVGRCEEAPVEHVFSFDHITRNGLLLRQQYPSL